PFFITIPPQVAQIGGTQGLVVQMTQQRDVGLGLHGTAPKQGDAHGEKGFHPAILRRRLSKDTGLLKKSGQVGTSKEGNSVLLAFDQDPTMNLLCPTDLTLAADVALSYAGHIAACASGDVTLFHALSKKDAQGDGVDLKKAHG